MRILATVIYFQNAYAKNTVCVAVVVTIVVRDSDVRKDLLTPPLSENDFAIESNENRFRESEVTGSRFLCLPTRKSLDIRNRHPYVFISEAKPVVGGIGIFQFSKSKRFKSRSVFEESRHENA